MKHCIIHPSEYYEATCPSCDRERASSSLQQDGSAAGVESGDNTVTCERCGGQGWYPAFDGHGNETHQEQCEACYGTGRVEKAKPQPNAEVSEPGGPARPNSRQT